jgi:serine/threonine-protein kinase
VTRPKSPELDDTIAVEGAPPIKVSNVPVAPDSLGAISSATPSGHHLVAGRYEILALLGVGGMGAVYRAKDARLDELVALKMLRGEHVSTPDMQRRFHDEVKLARKVTHRNVARTFDIGDHEGALFLTMELLHGESLGARIERDGALAINHAVDVAIDVANGLEAAHAAGVVHRDLKPDNVFLTKDARAVVTDFGIARTSAASEAGKTGGIIGTPAYMAPEQIEGRKDIDGRTDLYALGEVLYEMLTGVRAWPAPDPMASLAQRLSQPPPDVRATNADVSVPLAEIVKKLLARKPEDRFASATEVATALNAAKSKITPSMRPIEKNPLPKDARNEKTVAVLPFKSQGAPEWVPQGLLEDLIDTLSMTRGLRVRPVGVVESYAGTQAAARDIGRELGVSVVVEGSIRAVGADLRLSTRAIGVDDGFQIWAQRWQRPAAQILEVSDEAATAIATALTGSLQVPERGAQDPLAAETYLRARGELRAAYNSRELLLRVVGLFDAAIGLAPKDPHVLSGSAVAHARLAFFSQGPQLAAARDRAQDYADRAISLAPNLGEPWVAVATLRNYDGDFVGAGRALVSALRVAPNMAKARELLGRILLEVGDLDDGIALLEGALDLDPSCIDPRWDLVRGYALRGELERAHGLLDLPCAGSQAQRGWMRARLAMWFPDERIKAIALEEQIPDGGIVSMAVTSMQRFLRLGKMDESDRPYFEKNIAHGSKRIRLLARQSYAEFVGGAGDGAAAILTHIRPAVEDGLLDLAWLDRCPLIADARKDPSWPALRHKVEARASRVRVAIRE